MDQLIILRIVCLVIGYVFGLFQTAYILGKSKGIDIRDYGSGNAGTTNAMRILGTKAGLIVFLGDMLKALIDDRSYMLISQKIDDLLAVSPVLDELCVL